MGLSVKEDSILAPMMAATICNEEIECAARRPYNAPPGEAKSGRSGVGLTAAKMKDCRWLNPELVAQVELAEWTPEDHLRHAKFVGIREDKNVREVVREVAT